MSKATVPTKKQFDLLRVIVGGIALTPGYREWQAAVNRGWVEAAWGHELEPKRNGRYKSWPPLRLTPDGYRAVAAGIEKHGWPDPDREAAA
jgi:hypothetical protein